MLDPIFSLRQRIRLSPGEPMRVAFATGVAPDRDTALALALTVSGPERPRRARWRSPSRTPSAALRHLNISADEAVLFERLASRVLGGDESLRAASAQVAANELGQNSLWPHGISGDLPILLVRVVDDDLTARA